MYLVFYLSGNKSFANIRASICQTIPPLLSNKSGGKFVQNVNFRLHFVLFAVFYVILRRVKPLLKRDLPFCPTKIPLNGTCSRGISQLAKHFFFQSFYPAIIQPIDRITLLLALSTTEESSKAR